MMVNFLAITLIFAFVFLAAVHLYWAFSRPAAKRIAIPEVAGRPAFIPSRSATLGVAVSFFACALLVIVTFRFVPTLIPQKVLCWFTFGLALVFITRAIGEFRLIGFFKKVKGTTFARLDSTLYSPLSVAIAIGLFIIGSVSYP
jgi:hypothetical protein